MVQSDLYIHGPQAQRDAIVQMVMAIVQKIGVDTTRESALNIPMGMVMEVLVGDSIHLGLLIGLNTEDPECVVVRVEMKDELELRDTLLQCFPGIDIEVDEDVEDMVPWPFE
ncbi:MAG: hypothetical protein J6S07_01340 [Bacteroidaceae bacterium]|nr:hypothetical protein [Bacteroidaceae bacterium]